MNKRKFGNTGFEISEMGVGCGGYWGLEMFDRHLATRLVREAVDAGVTFFDTGASYSGGNAEIRLGEALRGVETSHLIIGTKAGTIIEGKTIYKNFTRQSITSQVESSLTKLRLERIPLLQLHGLPTESIEDVFETLDYLKRQGKVELVGVSADGDALDVALDFKPLDVIMLTYNVIQRQGLNNIEKAHERGCGIIVKSPLCHTLYSNDIFKMRNASDIWYLLRVFRNYRGLLLEGYKYRFIANFSGFSAHEVALLFALHPKVSCVVTGTISLNHMRQNLNTFGKSLPQEIRDHISST